MFPTVEEFIGKGGTLDWPETVVENSIPEHDKTYRKDGMECIGAMRFAKVRLAPGEKKEYIICAGITEKRKILTRSLKSITVKKRLKLRGNKMKSIGMEKLTR